MLKGAKLSLTLPPTIVAVGADTGKTIVTRTIGDMGAGSVNSEKISLIAVSGESTLQELSITGSYQLSPGGSRFEKTKASTVPINSSGILFDIKTPKEVFSGEEFEIDVTYKNTSDTAFPDARLTLTSPPAFTKTSATPQPDSGTGVWQIGSISPGSEGSFIVKGKLEGPASSFFEFHTMLESNVLGTFYTVSEKSAAITVATSPLLLNVTVNGAANYVANLNEDLGYSLSYSNTTNTALQDVVVRARLSGSLFDLATVSGGAFLRAADDTLIWNTANVPELASLAPGVSGHVDFRIKTRPAYPIQRAGDKNFTLKVAAEIESPTIPQFVGATKTSTRVDNEVKIAGAINVNAKALFRDAVSGIVNHGPFPPKVGQATQFTIHWILTNFATDVEKVEVRSFLGGNVRVVGTPTSNVGTTPVYNDRTQEIIWDINRLSATQGVIDPHPEAVFQVELTPSVIQVGTSPTLVQGTSATANDLFTGKVLQASDNVLTTELSDDPTIVSGNTQVVQ